MPISIECPTCTRRFKVQDAAAGKKVRCPNADCRTVCNIPGLASEDEWDDANFPELDAVAAAPSSAKKTASKKKSRRGGDGYKALRESEEPYLEVLMPDGEILPMEWAEMDALVWRGKLTRWAPARLIVPAHVSTSAYGFEKKHKTEKGPWKPVAQYWVNERSGEVVSHPGIALIVGGAVFVVLALVILVMVIAVEIDPRGVQQGAVAARGGGWRGFLVRGGAYFFPDAAIFVIKCMAIAIGWGFAAFMSSGIGWLAGLIFGIGWYYKYREPNSQPPPDGYPWKFWLRWQQRVLLWRALRKQRASAKSTKPKQPKARRTG